MEGKGKKKKTKGARPKKKHAAKVAGDDGALTATAIVDPWLELRSPLGGKLSPVEEWKRLQDYESHGRELTLTGCIAQAVLQAPTCEAFSLAIATKIPNNGKDSSGEIEAETRGPDDIRPIERLTIRGDGACFATTSACARHLLATGLVKLDVGGTQLDDAGLATVVRWTPWLRELLASGNNLTSIPVLNGLGKLQALDLSCNNIDSLSPVSFPPELGLTLRRLNLQGNRLDRLTIPADSEATQAGHADRDPPSASCALSVLTSLVDLDLSANKFQNAEHSLTVITRVGFPRLVSLDFRGNSLPCEEEAGELLRISTSLPTLRTLNGEEVKRKAMVLSSKKPMFELLSTGDQCVAEGRREESCSCTEGNPCAVAYHCRDWANRFEVAAAAAAGRGNSTR